MQLNATSMTLWRGIGSRAAGEAAALRLARLRAAIRGLRNTPCLFRQQTHSGDRVAISERHKIVFRVTPDTGDNATGGDVDVLRILGPGQSDD